MNIIAIANQKGGVGKTPTTVNLGFALARRGCKVLLVDLDPQGSLSEYFLQEKADLQEITVYNALISIKPIQPISITETIDLLPAHDELEASTLELPSKSNAERRLLKVLSFYQYDYCLIDCQPSLGILTRNALAAAHKVLIPVKTEISAERTLKRILGLIEEVKESDLNEELQIWGILPTLYTNNKAHHQEILRALKDKYQSLVYDEPSKDRTVYNDATTMKLDVSSLDKTLGQYWDRVAATFIEGRM